ncbi:MAG: hypothetical protein MUF82_01235 [Bacteroidetes bacterium]|nr:hypothetical protein [Bacteroidota bacterium]
MKRAVRCSCGAKTRDAEQETCIQCGRMLHEAEISCAIHPDSFAGGRCVVCGKPLCTACNVLTDERWLCAEDAEALREWMEVFQTIDPFAADAVVRNLAQNGFELRTYDHAQFCDDPHLTVGSPVLVFVRRERHADATSILRGLELDRIDVTNARNHH